MLSRAPSQLLGVESGVIEAGAPADLILYAPETPWKIDGSKFSAAAGNTPFEGLPTQGRVLKTIKGGRILS
jgi:dihydroorotase